jgi:nitrite reductase/ring-hydroxylating ferredoxin subunit
MQIERRKFLTSACKACFFAGAGIFLGDALACSPSIKIIHLPVLQNSYVSLPVTAFANDAVQVIRPEGWLYDIAARKISTGQYEALLLECTHQQNQLMVDPNGYRCALHGSRFDLEGQVVKGPAETALKKYATRLDMGQLIIQLKS